DLAVLPASERQLLLRRLIERVAILIRALHALRVSQRDLKAANILVGSLPTADGLNVWLIDLVGIRRCLRLSRHRRVQNLARLHASFCQAPRFTRTDKLRFLRTYLQWGLFGRHRWKRWWQEIAAATEAKVARNVKSGRPLA